MAAATGESPSAEAVDVDESAGAGNACAGSGAICSWRQLTKDDIEFRKKVYREQTGRAIAVSPVCSLGYDTNRKYPLLLWLHGGDGRGRTM